MPRTQREPDPIITVETLTPHDAQTMIEASDKALKELPAGYFQNRKPSWVEIRERREQMEDGEFDTWAHMGVRLDKHGVILNGNHTLHALAGADETTTITCIMIRNVPRQSASSMDTGRRRNNAQALEMAGVEDTGAKTMATKIIYALSTDFPTKRLGAIRMTNPEIERWYFDHRSMDEFIPLAKRLQAEVGIRAGLALGIMYLGNNEHGNYAMTEEFVEGVCNPHTLSASDPRARLAAKYAQLRREGRTGGGGARLREAIIEFVKCWNRYMGGSTIGRLVVGAEEAPEPVAQAGSLVAV